MGHLTLKTVCFWGTTGISFRSFLVQHPAAETIIFAFISGLLILVRGEFVFIYLITLLYFLYKKKIKFINLLLTILLTLAVISPYLVRNYIVFKEVVLVKSFGYNLWKGNNQFSSVEGHSGIENAIFKNKALQ